MLPDKAPRWKKILHRTKLLRLMCVVIFLFAFQGISGCDQGSGETLSTVSNDPLVSEKPDYDILLIPHGSCPWSYFWCTLENGAVDAAKALNVDLTIWRPNEFKPTDQNELLEKAYKTYGSVVDGIGVTIVSPDKVRGNALFKDQKVPVVAFNAGSPEEDNIPYRAYIGMDDEDAGWQAGRRLIDKAREVATGRILGICISHESGENLKRRCNGFKRAIKEKTNIDYDRWDIRRVETNEEAATKILLHKYKEASKGADFFIFLTLGPDAATPFYNFIDKARLHSNKDFVHGMFDLSRPILKRIGNGTTLFTVDQQPYVQGYLTVQWLTWILRHGLQPPDQIPCDSNADMESSADCVPPTVPTGPRFVECDKESDCENKMQSLQGEVGQYR